jgi:hypothetical protein
MAGDDTTAGLREAFEGSKDFTFECSETAEEQRGRGAEEQESAASTAVLAPLPLGSPAPLLVFEPVAK